jgi:tetratricopeptide (TPR) repeat protein
MAKPVKGNKKNIVKLAHLYFREGQWDDALGEFRKLLELDPDDVNLHKILGDIYVKKNDPGKAYEEYARAAAQYLHLGQIDKAELIHKKIAGLDKNQLPSQTRPPLPFPKPGSDDLVVPDSEKTGEKTGHLPDTVEECIRLGDSYLKINFLKKALEVLKKALALDPQSRQARLGLVQVHLKLGSESGAKKEYLILAEQALGQDDLDSAWEYANKAAELKSIEALYLVGMVLLKRQQWTEAKAQLENLLRFKVRHIGAQVALAKVYDGMNQTEKAVEIFQQALKFDKDGVTALEGWADHCVRTKKKNEAVLALTALADRASASGDFIRAARWARTMVSVDSDLVAAHLKLAQALEGGNDLIGAADAYCRLASIHESQNQPEEAAKAIQKALDLNPKHPEALVQAPEALPPKADEARERLSFDPITSVEPVIPVSVPEAITEPVKPPVATPQEILKAQIDVAEQCVVQGYFLEAISMYQQLLEGAPDNTEIKEKLNQVYTTYVKTGMDLTRAFVPMTPVDEAVQTADQEAAKKILKAVEAKALEEADFKLNDLQAKRARAEAKKAALAAAKKTLKLLENKARNEADQMIRAVLERKESQKDQNMSFLKKPEALSPNDPKDGPGVVAEELLNPEAPPPSVNAVFVLKVNEPAATTNQATSTASPEKDLNMTRISKRVGFV